MAIVCKVGGVDIPPPKSIKYNYIPLTTDEERNEQGELYVRPLAHKRKVAFEYEYILGKDIKSILGKSWEQYESSKVYKFDVSYPGANGSQETIKAYFSELNFNLEIWNDNSDLRVYSGFSVTWIEY